MSTKNKFTNYLLKIAREGSGCSIQHKGSPCNSCFHYWAENTLELHPTLSHALWLVNLSLRGDYNDTDLTEAVEDLKKL